MFNSNNSQLGNQPGFTIERKMLAVFGVAALLPMLILALSIVGNSFQLPAMIGAIVAQVVGLWVGYQVVAGIVRQSTNINQTLQSINNGDLEARATSWTKDELGLAANSLNAMCDNSLNLLQSSDERDEVQSSIESLIDEMKLIAAGDLTIKTDVGGNVTGAIAETVNHMTQQLRAIVQQVQLASEEVNGSTEQLRQASADMSQNSDGQASLITEASEQILSMTDSFQQVACLTKESEHVAVEARNATARGLQAVSDTVDGMQRIRDQVQSTSKRIKRLGESSQEIGEIVQMISDIADRTSILALNASIQAAMAGDAGHGFAVVAEEIECLAERSTNATKQISKLIRAIQNETSEVISDMEESTREVVAGSQLAAEAGNTLSEIDDVSSQLVDMIQKSSTSALEQADMASGIANSMSEIASSTRESADTHRVASQSFDQLSDLVDQLRNSVSQFKLSNSGSAHDTIRERSAQKPSEPRVEKRVAPTVEKKTAPRVETKTKAGFVSPLAKSKKKASPKTPAQDSNAIDPASRFDMPRVAPKSPTMDESSSVTHVDILSDSGDERGEQNTHRMTVEFDDANEKVAARDIDEKLLKQVREATVFLNTDNAKLESKEDSEANDEQSDGAEAGDNSTSRTYPRTIMMDDV